jgi:tungstate transport system substrate-binding protein
VSRIVRRLLVAGVVALALGGCHREGRPLRIGTTTSVQDSGLLDVLLAAYTETSRVPVAVIAVGTGAAFKLARDGNVDLLLVHDRDGEEQFVAAGDGLSRHDLMWNTFEVLGPPDDPAGVRGAETGSVALARIGAAGAPFVSRGDDSGTHRREKKLWGPARPQWPGYRETGQGMGATLRVADELGAYVLTDRGTRLGYKGTLRLVPLVADTPDLRNEYSVVVLNPAKHPDLSHDGARRLADWLLSPAAARVIEGFQVGGQRLFHPVRSVP